MGNKKEKVYLGYDLELGLFWAIASDDNKPGSQKVPGLLSLTQNMQYGKPCYMIFYANIDCKLAGQLSYWLAGPDLKFDAVIKTLRFLWDSKLIDSPHLARQ